MTPKEKAKELILQFKKVGSKTQAYAGARFEETSLNTEEAKQCVIILCEQMIKYGSINPSPIPVDSLDACVLQARDFWKEVKKECVGF